MTRTLAGLAVCARPRYPAASAWAAPPTIKATTPFGVTRGVATEVTFNGDNLTGNP